MHHTYINTDKAFNEVLSTFDSKGKIVIGFNFDTIHFNEFGSGEDYFKIIDLLIDLEKLGCELVCYEVGILNKEYVSKYLYKQNIFANYGTINSDNLDVILDNRCGLSQVFNELRSLVSLRTPQTTN
jgi:hypothetical protein